MDDRSMTDLLQRAAGDPPNATFDESDIARTSLAITRKRRKLAAGSALAVVVVACGGVALGLGVGQTDQGGPVQAAGAPSTSHVFTMEKAKPTKNLPVDPSLQGDGSRGNVDPNSGCRQADGELAAALAGELPSAAQPKIPAFRCPPGSKFAGFAASNETVGALLVPKGADEGSTPAMSTLPRDATFVTVATPSGGTLYLESEGAAATPADQLKAKAHALATHF